MREIAQGSPEPLLHSLRSPISTVGYWTVLAAMCARIACAWRRRTAREIKVHPHDAQHLAADADIGHHRAARLERGQMDRLAIEHLGILAYQQRIAVPSHARGAAAERDRLPRALLGEQMAGEHRAAPPEAAIGFLERDHVGVDLAQHLKGALGPPLPIGADRLAHVVAGDLDHRCPLWRGEHRIGKGLARRRRRQAAGRRDSGRGRARPRRSGCAR